MIKSFVSLQKGLTGTYGNQRSNIKTQMAVLRFFLLYGASSESSYQIRKKKELYQSYGQVFFHLQTWEVICGWALIIYHRGLHLTVDHCDPLVLFMSENKSICSALSHVKAPWAYYWLTGSVDRKWSIWFSHLSQFWHQNRFLNILISEHSLICEG